MNANEMADLMILFDSGRIYEHSEEIATMLRQQQEKLTKYELRHVAQRDRIAILEMQHKQQQAEIEALKNGFNTTWAGTNNSEMAEVRAMANRCILKIRELEFEQEGFENLVEMLESEKEELVEKTRKQQVEIEALKKRPAINKEDGLVCAKCYERIGQ